MVLLSPKLISCIVGAAELPLLPVLHLHLHNSVPLHLCLLPVGAVHPEARPGLRVWQSHPQGARQHCTHHLRLLCLLVSPICLSGQANLPAGNAKLPAGHTISPAGENNLI